MNWQIFVSAALLLVATYAGCDAATPAQVRTLAPGVLRIGTYFVNPPFEYISNGDEIDFEVDLITKLARRLRLRPSFVNSHWERVLRQMREGRYDWWHYHNSGSAAGAGVVHTLYDRHPEPNRRSGENSVAARYR